MSIRSVRRGPAKRIKPSRGLPVSPLVCLWGTFPAFVVSEVWTVFIWQRILKRLNTVQRQRCARSILLLQRAWTDKWWDVTLLKYTFTLLYFCCLLIPLDYILDANIAFCSFLYSSIYLKFKHTNIIFITCLLHCKKVIFSRGSGCRCALFLVFFLVDGHKHERVCSAIWNQRKICAEIQLWYL